MSRFYVTTPIYYVNALPHLGTFYTTVVADALARYHRARHGKENVLFLTGLDEHGQKIERIARERGLEPQTYCDEIAGKFEETWQRFEISNDDFIRTTQPRHKKAATEMWRRLEEKGDIYLELYEGMYCVGCESNKTEDEVVTENDVKLCAIHRTPIERVKEKNYFFRLSKYKEQLLAWYDQRPSPVQPESRRNEVRAFVAGDLRDISISRMAASVKWGIPVPNDPSHLIYVWIDALTNYLTVLGGPEAVAKGAGDRAAFWSASHHLIAKDILRFHAVYWPAMLWSAGLTPPKQVFCHGYLTVKGQKISKSIPATKVDPNAIAGELGVDPLRYFVLREYALGGDGDFTYEALFQRHQSDLGNDLGNLLNRTLSMVHKFIGAGTGTNLAARPQANAAAGELLQLAQAGWEGFSPANALEATWRLVRTYNQKIDEAKPWVLHKGGKLDELADVLAGCCEALRWAALMVAPAMPVAAREILRQLGRAGDEGTWPSTWGWPGGTLTEPKPVFPRVDPDRQKALIDQWSGAAAPTTPAVAAPPAATAAKPASVSAAPGDITIDEFAKIDLRAAKVLACERVPKADKLLKLTLDIGGAPRTVLSGIAPAYTPETIVGKTVIYLSNLAPKKIRGIESQGMILAAGDDDVLGLSALDRDVPPGTKIR
jgi:methionyl-tRNA synthetase